MKTLERATITIPLHEYTKLVNEHADLNAKLTQVEADAAAMREALTEIASFDEGGVVSGKFDEPCAATRARVTLESISKELEAK